MFIPVVKFDVLNHCALTGLVYSDNVTMGLHRSPLGTVGLESPEVDPTSTKRHK